MCWHALSTFFRKKRDARLWRIEMEIARMMEQLEALAASAAAREKGPSR